MSAVAIRRATTDDARLLARLDAACFEVPWDERSLLSLLAGELTRGWCAVRADAAVGYALVRVVAGEGEILRMGVEPTQRRQSVGSALLTGIVTDLAGEIPHGLHLEVRAANDAAQRLYTRYGFQRTGVRTAYYADPPDDAIRMRWQPGLECEQLPDV